MKKNIIATALLLSCAGSVLAAENYDPHQSYASGEQVYFDGKLYQAQWWANPNQSPAEITENSWDSPWVLISDSPEITPPVEPPVEPEIPTPPPTDGNHPSYVEGNRYVGGDIVENDGRYYRCKFGATEGWCSQPAYEPGQGNVWQDAWEEIEATVTETFSLSYLGNSFKLNHSTFGYATESEFAPESIAINNNILYVGNTAKKDEKSNIDRYDLVNKRALSPITGFTLNGKAETIRVVSDITVHNDRLYMASLSSNRVDIYDTKNNNQIIMSLGTGVYWGDKFRDALTHPYAVAANDNYVFVADITGKISIYLQSDVTLENHKRAVKHAFFDLPDSNSIHRNLKLEVVGDKLIVSFDNGKTYVFDITNIEESQKLVEAKYVINNANRRSMYEAQNGAIFAGTRSGMIEEYPAGKFSFNENGVATAPLHTFNRYYNTAEKREEMPVGAFDFAVENNTLALLQGKTVVLADKVQLTVSVKDMPNNEQPTDFDLTSPEVSKAKLLQNDESWESLIQNHEVRVNRILSGKQGIDKLEITSYAAQTTYDLDVEARFGSKGEWINLGTITQLEPFSKHELNYTLQDGHYYTSVDQLKSYAISGLENLDYLPSDLIDIRLTSDTDTFVQKITDLKPSWRLRFGNYSPETHGKWGRITGPYAREWMIMMTNFAYIMNSPEFEHIWFNYKETFGQGTNEFFGNAGPVNAPNGNFTAADYQRVYQQFMNRDLIHLGVSTIGGGLGGGTVLGIDTWLFYGHYYRSGFGILAHEFGHGFGSHSSAFANSGAGLQPLFTQMHHMMLLDKVLPYVDEEINAFYASPQELLHNTVSNGIRTPLAPDHTNWMIEYFKANPLH
ncbi:hypothetical protein [Vibrio mimicus]|uniref:hypothetical protein n=1 Tax=Vibrio mimicus TaxID=674 RepID=UPI0001BAD87C|nr:hypothetical protein [Vibrio mimicus]EEY38126.1 basic endochitinase [Vibrio mimicus MB451]